MHTLSKDFSLVPIISEYLFLSPAEKFTLKYVKYGKISADLFFVNTKPFRVKNVSYPQQAKSQQYLGDSDEIEAYGHNIAVELLRSYGSRKNALTALKNFTRIGPDTSPDMYAYLVTFGMDKNHPVLKKLIKKIILFLKEIEK